MSDCSGGHQRQVLPWQRHDAAQRVKNCQRLRLNFDATNKFGVGQLWELGGIEELRWHAFTLQRALQNPGVGQRKISHENSAGFPGQFDRVSFGQGFELVGSWSDRIRLQEAVRHIKGAMFLSGRHPISADLPGPDSTVPPGKSRARRREFRWRSLVTNAVSLRPAK